MFDHTELREEPFSLVSFAGAGAWINGVKERPPQRKSERRETAFCDGFFVAEGVTFPRDPK
jgi:hypothetical protein